MKGMLSVCCHVNISDDQIRTKIKHFWYKHKDDDDT